MHPPSSSNPTPRRRRGPWGTTLRDEKRYGYPSPVRSPLDDIETSLERLEDRIERLELQLDALLDLQSQTSPLGATFCRP